MRAVRSARTYRQWLSACRSLAAPLAHRTCSPAVSSLVVRSLATSVDETGRSKFAPGSPASAPREKLVILGTGWASFRVLSDIDEKKFDVSVVSPRNHLLFTPMLASSALGTVNQRSICQPVRPVVKQKGASYYESNVYRVDSKEKKVYCTSPGGREYTLPFDKLVVGVGFQPNDFNTPGVKEHALFMKETKDATVFKDHVLQKLEEASYLPALDSDLTVTKEEEQTIRELLTFVVVGGGPTGVELAGELTDFIHKECKQLYDLHKYVTVHMLTYDVLNVFDQELQDYALKHLRKKQGVQVHLETFVKHVEADVVHATQGQNKISIKYGTLVWCAGVKPHKFVKDYGFQMDERGQRILTDRHLKVSGEEDIYAIGDCSTIEGYWLPQTAQVATQEGVYLAKHLNGGETSEPFVFHNKGMLAYLGGFTALMAKLPVPGLGAIKGFTAFLGWRFVYWSLQLSMRNRFMLSTDWLRTLLFGRDLTRFGERSSPD